MLKHTRSYRWGSQRRKILSQSQYFKHELLLWSYFSSKLAFLLWFLAQSQVWMLSKYSSRGFSAIQNFYVKPLQDWSFCKRLSRVEHTASKSRDTERCTPQRSSSAFASFSRLQVRLKCWSAVTCLIQLSSPNLRCLGWEALLFWPTCNNPWRLVWWRIAYALG